MASLDELRQKYPASATSFKFDPRHDCPRCMGAGEYICGNGNLHFCFCIFIETDVPVEYLKVLDNAFNRLGKGGE